MKHLVMLVGPPGSGKSTLSKEYVEKGFLRINQDDQGKDHLHLFDLAVLEGKDIVLDRMNFSKGQRARYLDVVRPHGYFTTIIVLHEPQSVCLERAIIRKDHPTIQDEGSARKAIHFFFSRYERVEESEADIIKRRYSGSQSTRRPAIICDLDGTLCDIEHRRHFVRGHTDLPKHKKDWKSFFDHMSEDTLNKWCSDILERFSHTHEIVFCSGRGKEHEDQTRDWLVKHLPHTFTWHLFMRERHDSRNDSIIKEILLDFEILTRFEPYFVIDDRDRVVEMWRKRGLVCLQCAYGDF